MSYQDTTFYALLGLMATVGLKQDDANIQQAGPVGVWQSVATGKSVGMAGVPDWIASVQAAGAKVNVLPTDEFFPHMAQGIAVSDDMIKKNPQMIRKFVGAALKGMKDVMDNPDQAAVDFVKFVPEWQGKENEVKVALNYYAKLVYPGQKQLGEVNVERLTKLQDFYLAKGFIQKKSAGGGPLQQRVYQVTTTAVIPARCPRRSGEPGIHNHQLGVWIPALALTALGRNDEEKFRRKQHEHHPPSHAETHRRRAGRIGAAAIRLRAGLADARHPRHGSVRGGKLARHRRPHRARSAVDPARPVDRGGEPRRRRRLDRHRAGRQGRPGRLHAS